MPKLTVRLGSEEEVIGLNNQLPEFDDPYDLDYLHERIKDAESLYLVGEVDDVPAGFVIGYDRDKDGSLYCWLGGVLPGFRKMGLFKKLMCEMEKIAKEEGYKSVKVKSYPEFQAMLRFLNKGGYELTLKELANDERGTPLHFEKPL